MKKFLVTYLAPASVIDEWKKTDPETRKAAESQMRENWGKWMGRNASIFVDRGAGVGKTRRVTAQGAAPPETTSCSMQSCRRSPTKRQQSCLKITRISEFRAPPSRSWRFTLSPAQCDG